MPLPIGNGSLPAQAAKPSTAVNPIAACTNRFMESPSVDEGKLPQCGSWPLVLKSHTLRKYRGPILSSHSGSESRRTQVIRKCLPVAVAIVDVLQMPAMQVRRPECNQGRDRAPLLEASRRCAKRVKFSPTIKAPGRCTGGDLSCCIHPRVSISSGCLAGRNTVACMQHVPEFVAIRG